MASWVIAGATLLLVLWLHLLPALFAGLLVYELVHVLAPRLQRNLSSQRSRILAVAVLAALIVGLITAAILGAVAFLRSEAGSFPALFERMAVIIEDARVMLPEWLADSLPSGGDGVREALTSWLREHAPQVQLVGKEALHTFVRIVIGMIIGAMMSLREVEPVHVYQPLAQALNDRADRLGDSFRRVVFAQVRIAAINTVFTAIYLAVVLPLAGIHLPLIKTMIAITFAAGMLPVIGNLISNTAIVVVSLTHSPQVALISLAFLLTIHKLEYFLNARIVGSKIHAKAWELLLAMLVMDAAFGLPGVAAAPIYYAYLKNELEERQLV